MFEDSVIIEKLKNDDSEQDIIVAALHHHAPSGVFKPNIEPISQYCNREEAEDLLATLRRAHHKIDLVNSEHQGDTLTEHYTATKNGGTLHLHLRRKAGNTCSDKLCMSYDSGCGITWGLRYSIRTKELSAHLKHLRAGCAVWAEELPALKQRITELQEQVEAGQAAIRNFCDTLCADTTKGYEAKVDYHWDGYDATLYLRAAESCWLTVELRAEQPVSQLQALRPKLARAVAALSKLKQHPELKTHLDYYRQ